MSPRPIDIVLRDLDADRLTERLARRDRLQIRGTWDDRERDALIAMLHDLHRRTTMMPVLRALRDRQIRIESAYRAYQDGPEALAALLRRVTALKLSDLLKQYAKAQRHVREMPDRVKRIQRFIDWLGGDDVATTEMFTTANVQDYLGQLDYAPNATRKAEGPPNPATIANHRMGLSGFATWMMQRNLLAKHPIAYKAVPKPSAEKHRMPAKFTRGDYLKYVKTAYGVSPYASIALDTMLHSGADLSEVIYTFRAKAMVRNGSRQKSGTGLHARDILPGHPAQIRFQRAKWLGAKERLIPVPATVYEPLKQIITQNLLNGNDLLFRGLSEHTLRRAHKAAAKAIGRPDLRLKDLRHIAAMHWLDNGVPLIQVQKRLGHATLAQTAVYLDYVAPSREVAEQVERAADAWRDE